MKFLSTLAALAAVLLPLSAGAADVTAGNITVSNPWARATAGMVAAGGAFLTLTNQGSEADALVAATADVADKVELHTHINDNGVMRMRSVEAIEIPAGGVAELKPGGLHVMLIGLKAPLKQGESFPLRLTFKRTGTATVMVAVQGPGAMGMGHMPGHGG
ncbi:MAG TPA: copper chaperone PCu(A)C [Azospirillaceae bacterium]|nr:copper chaperone PCu(A)C [Azospirillaceae bacterium]